MIRLFTRAAVTACIVLVASSIQASDSAVSEPAPESAVQLYVPPEFTPSSGDFYPQSAARRLLQGAVGIEFQIDAQGRAQNLQQTYADNSEFAEKTQAFLKSGQFKVSDDWGQTSGPDLRFVVEVQFSLARGSDCEKKPPRVADTEVLVVCKVLVSRRERRLNS